MDLFPARLDGVSPWAKIFFYHVPRSKDKYALLEQMRIEECDEGKYEMYLDAMWQPAMAFQQLLDRLELFFPDRYKHEVEAMRQREIEFMVREAATKDLIDHRNDGGYRTYEAALQVLSFYGVGQDEKWLDFIAQYQEIEDRNIEEFQNRQIGL